MKGKIRNQRLSSSRLRKQQHLLEVSVRADKARSLRNRAIAAFTCKAIFFAALAVGAWIGGKEGLRRLVWENADLALSDIRVSTDGSLQRDQILQAGGVRSGVNIFRVNTDQIRAGIDKLPQVERAEIQVIRPNRLDITVTERRPIAWVTERADEIPAVFTRIHIHFVVSGKDLKEAQVKRAVDLSAEKYCSASIMFGKAGVAVSHSYEIAAEV